MSMKRNFSLLQNRKFDLLVCGGGIYGAWVAYDAALRGLKVAIVDQGDWAGATSSASSKLIHGGLRYLESYDFKLVKKALSERSMLLQAAPHRVWPLRFGVPVYTDSRIGSLQLKLGLTLYDFLAGRANPEMRHRHFNRKRFFARFPMLNPAALKRGFTYPDAQTDDARLVLELIAGAIAAGAVCVNYCKVTNLCEANGQACGASIQDMQHGDIGEIHARQVVYATGQWTTASAQGREWCRLAKGVHLVMPGILHDEALLLTAKSDGRVFFVIPWYGVTLLGTTDTDYHGNIEQVTVEESDICYLLAAANDYLGTVWTLADIIGKYAGVRVLKQSTQTVASDSPSAVSRDWELKTTENGVHYSIGGKLTSARQDAACIVDTICARLGHNAACATNGKAFPWSPPENFAAWMVMMNARAAELGIDAESAKWLIRRHGTRVTEIFHSIENTPILADRIFPSLPLIVADLLFCARTEMAVHLADLLRRRMPMFILAQLTKNDMHQLATKVASIMGWDDGAVNREVEHCHKQWLAQ
jgi:glycerol-3-phosphate dehydrogenase